MNYDKKSVTNATNQPDGIVRPSAGTRRGMRILTITVGILLAVVIIVPTVLSSQDLVRWAHSPTGLGLGPGWSVLVFIALDAAAAACVGMVVFCAWRGETAGLYGILVWAFAGTSAFANYRFNVGGQARDAVWFFPTMSLAGPLLLEITIRRIRRWVQTSAGRYENPLPHFRFARWVPGIGAMRETYGAWRTAILDGGISTPESAISRFRQLCPDGRPRVVRAMRAESARLAQEPKADQRPEESTGPVGVVDALDGSPLDCPQAVSPLRLSVPARPGAARRIPAVSRGRRLGRPSQAVPAIRAGDAEDLDRLARVHSAKRPGKAAIARTLGVGGPKSARLAALVAALPSWPIGGPTAEPAQINGRSVPAIGAGPEAAR